jgi:hypothetical protein
MQALTTLNDRAFVEFAQGLASRVLRAGLASDAERIRHAFRLCLARQPGAAESERLERFLNQQLEEFRAAPEDARSMAPPKLPPGFDQARAAAWTAVARVVLNLDEFITRE